MPFRSGAAGSMTSGPHAPACQHAIVPLPMAVCQSELYVSTGASAPDAIIASQRCATRVTSGEVKLIVMFVAVDLERGCTGLPQQAHEPALVGGEVGEVAFGTFAW